VHTYTPAATVAAEKHITLVASAAGIRPIEGPVELEVDAEFLVPKSWTKRQLAAMEKNDRWHTGRPDVDNIGKLCQDALNGIAYHDDSQVCCLSVRKYYSFALREGLKIRITSKVETREVVENCP
jgi:Holliday junction resolvase RusA-like endonuclease